MIKVFFDTETTNLLGPEAGGQEQQPHLIEFAAVKYRDDEKVDELYLVMNPRVPIPEESTKAHGYTNDMLKGMKPFSMHWKQIARFWRDADVQIGHNLMFDKNVLHWELRRISKQLNFPWASNDVCTVEVCTKWLGHRLSLTDLHIKLFGNEFSGAHSAMNDVNATIACYQKLVGDGVIKEQ